jgi:hypothetical protein
LSSIQNEGEAFCMILNKWLLIKMLCWFIFFAKMTKKWESIYKENLYVFSKIKKCTENCAPMHRKLCLSSAAEFHKVTSVLHLIPQKSCKVSGWLSLKFVNAIRS